MNVKKMENNIKAKCIELCDLMQQKFNLQQELEPLIKQYAEVNRKFANGEVVMICSVYDDTEIGQGMVADVKTVVSFEHVWLKYYLKDDRFDEALNSLRYEIYAIKNDGTQSKKHYFDNPHFIGDTKKHSDIYIKKINTNGH